MNIRQRTKLRTLSYNYGRRISVTTRPTRLVVDGPGSFRQRSRQAVTLPWRGILETHDGGRKDAHPPFPIVIRLSAYPRFQRLLTQSLARISDSNKTLPNHLERHVAAVALPITVRFLLALCKLAQ
jgi:hypothetical protein